MVQGEDADAAAADASTAVTMSADDGAEPAADGPPSLRSLPTVVKCGRAPHSRTSTVRLSDLNPHLICALCGGYYVDATTVIECLHSFCRTCILKHLDKSNSCPVCEIQIHKTRPLLSIRRDQILQDIVYKLVPGLFRAEMRRRREFYKDVEEKELPENPEARGEIENPGKYITPDERISLSLQYLEPSAHQPPSKKAKKSRKHRRRSSKSPSPGSLSLLVPLSSPGASSTCSSAMSPLSSLPTPTPSTSNKDAPPPTVPPAAAAAAAEDAVAKTSLEDGEEEQQTKMSVVAGVPTASARRYLSCPAAVSVSLLKKFVQMKYQLSAQEHLVDLFYQDENLADELTLMDLAATYAWQRDGKPKEFFFQIHQRIGHGRKRRSVDASASATLKDRPLGVDTLLTIAQKPSGSSDVVAGAGDGQKPNRESPSSSSSSTAPPPATEVASEKDGDDVAAAPSAEPSETTMEESEPAAEVAEPSGSATLPTPSDVSGASASVEPAAVDSGTSSSSASAERNDVGDPRPPPLATSSPAPVTVDVGDDGPPHRKTDVVPAAAKPPPKSPKSAAVAAYEDALRQKLSGPGIPTNKNKVPTIIRPMRTSKTASVSSASSSSSSSAAAAAAKSVMNNRSGSSSSVINKNGTMPSTLTAFKRASQQPVRYPETAPPASPSKSTGNKPAPPSSTSARSNVVQPQPAAAAVAPKTFPQPPPSSTAACQQRAPPPPSSSSGSKVLPKLTATVTPKAAPSLGAATWHPPPPPPPEKKMTAFDLLLQLNSKPGRASGAEQTSPGAGKSASQPSATTVHKQPAAPQVQTPSRPAPVVETSAEKNVPADKEVTGNGARSVQQPSPPQPPPPPKPREHLKLKILSGPDRKQARVETILEPIVAPADSSSSSVPPPPPAARVAVQTSQVTSSSSSSPVTTTAAAAAASARAAELEEAASRAYDFPGSPPESPPTSEVNQTLEKLRRVRLPRYAAGNGNHASAAAAANVGGGHHRQQPHPAPKSPKHRDAGSHSRPGSGETSPREPVPSPFPMSREPKPTSQHRKDVLAVVDDDSSKENKEEEDVAVSETSSTASCTRSKTSAETDRCPPSKKVAGDVPKASELYSRTEDESGLKKYIVSNNLCPKILLKKVDEPAPPDAFPSSFSCSGIRSVTSTKDDDKADGKKDVAADSSQPNTDEKPSASETDEKEPSAEARVGSSNKASKNESAGGAVTSTTVPVPVTASLTVAAAAAAVAPAEEKRSPSVSPNGAAKRKLGVLSIADSLLAKQRRTDSGDGGAKEQRQPSEEPKTPSATASPPPPPAPRQEQQQQQRLKFDVNSSFSVSALTSPEKRRPSPAPAPAPSAAARNAAQSFGITNSKTVLQRISPSPNSHASMMGGVKPATPPPPPPPSVTVNNRSVIIPSSITLTKAREKTAPPPPPTTTTTVQQQPQPSPSPTSGNNGDAPKPKSKRPVPGLIGMQSFLASNRMMNSSSPSSSSSENGGGGKVSADVMASIPKGLQVSRKTSSSNSSPSASGGSFGFNSPSLTLPGSSASLSITPSNKQQQHRRTPPLNNGYPSPGPSSTSPVAAAAAAAAAASFLRQVPSGLTIINKSATSSSSSPPSAASSSSQQQSDFDSFHQRFAAAAAAGVLPPSFLQPPTPSQQRDDVMFSNAVAAVAAAAHHQQQQQFQQQMRAAAVAAAAAAAAAGNFGPGAEFMARLGAGGHLGGGGNKDFSLTHSSSSSSSGSHAVMTTPGGATVTSISKTQNQSIRNIPNPALLRRQVAQTRMNNNHGHHHHNNNNSSASSGSGSGGNSSSNKLPSPSSGMGGGGGGGNSKAASSKPPPPLSPLFKSPAAAFLGMESLSMRQIGDPRH